MEDEHRYIPTPTRDRTTVGSNRSSSGPGLLHHPLPFGERGSKDSAPSHVNKGRKKFVNTRSFSTLTTKLSACYDQPNNQESSLVANQGLEKNDTAAGVDISHSEIVNNRTTGCEGETSKAIDIPTSDSSEHLDTLAHAGTSHFGVVRASGLSGSTPGNNEENSPTHFDFGQERVGLVLLGSESSTLNKTDSIGFQVSSTATEYATDKNISEPVYSRISDTEVSKTLSDQNDISEMTVPNEVVNSSQPAYPSTEHAKGSGHHEIIQNSISDQYEVPSRSIAMPTQEKSDHQDFQETVSCTDVQQDEPVSLLTGSLSSASRPNQSDNHFVFQKPLPVSPSTKPATPTFRRQTSKRKSEIFGAFLPYTIQERSEDNSDEDCDDSDDDFHSLGGSHGRRSDPCTPTSPKARRVEDYDPYRIFEVQHTPCLILTVRVLRGRDITLGFRDLYDTPDPYVNLVMKSSPEGRKSTTVKNDNKFPVWNESFTFYINFTQANILEISLMESNYLRDLTVGTVYFDIVDITEMDKPQLETFVFNDVSQVDIEFKLEFDRNPTLRYSLCLSEAEKTFMERRKEKNFEGLKKLLGEEEGPMNLDEVPTIAVLGSGGGFRAMTGYSGVIKALVETGVLDCSMYACGLSGSSWLVSTLYSHPKWPNLDMNEFLDEMKHNVDKSLFRFFSMSTMYNYAKFMVEKRREGQPVSFTDIFGRMVGETLLNGRMESTLTDQREKIKDGAVPMPLYTCVHVKKDVPAKSFQEWVEFSPYEIGLPKYGTFMDSELFGSKFFMGKLVKKFKEQPLHFLQGIWGSAFCILFKRLLEDNRRIDPVEMVRQEMGEQLDEAGQESSSDCSDDEVDYESDSSSFTSSTDSDAGSVREAGSGDLGDGRKRRTSREEQGQGASSSGAQRHSVEMMESSDVEMESRRNSKDETEKIRFEINRNSSDADVVDYGDDDDDEIVDGDSAYEGEEDGYEDENDMCDDPLFQSSMSTLSPRGIMKRKGSVEMMRARKNQPSSQDSASQDQVGEVKSLPSMQNADLELSSDQKKSVNWGACPRRVSTNDSTDTQKRRQAYIRAGSSMRKSRSGSKSYWGRLMKGIVESNSWELLSTRRGRAAVIHNFMRGLSLERSYPLSPFTPIDERVKEGDEFDGIFEMHPTSVKHIYMVDAGLTFNSPYPLVLRPQRGVDIILSFDFSARPSDGHQPFKELLLAEKWARLNRLPFPPIDTSVFEREGMKELYIFKHPTNPHCPVVLHFVLINKTFKYYKKPGVPRETKEEFNFAEFDVFDDPKAPYSTFNFTYTHENFDRLSQLMEFNTLLHIDEIKQVIKDVIKQKREGPPRVPIQSKDIQLLRMKSVQEMRKLRKYISRMESRSSLHSSNSPSTPFYTPTPSGEISSNPFFAGYHRELSLSSSNDSIFSSPRDKLSVSDGLSRSLRGRKHIHPSDIFSESEEFKSQGSLEQDVLNKSNVSSLFSSTDSVFGTPPNSTHHFQNIGQISANSGVNLEPIEVSDNPNKNETKIQTGSDHVEIDTDNSNVQNVESSTPNDWDPVLKSPQADDRRPSLSPKVKIPSPSETAVTNNINSSGTGSSGSGGFFTHGNKTPGSSSSGRSSSGISNQGSGSSISQFMSKGKVKKEPPPNPFFAKAHFMRSGQTSSSSGISSPIQARPDDGTGKKINPQRGNSYRLSSQTPMSSNSSGSSGISSIPNRLNSRSANTSPLVSNSGTKTNPPESQPTLPPGSPEEFVLAPEAFRADGTPVFDPEQAKMFYEGAKDRRKVFRRQSTISSLSSISLECTQPDTEICEENSYNGSGSPVVPHKGPVINSDSHFHDHFHSCVEDTHNHESNINNEQLVGNTGQQKRIATDYGVDFDIEDLSQFSGIDNSNMRQMDHWNSSEPSESVDDSQDLMESQEIEVSSVASTS